MREYRLVKLHKRLWHALALPSLAAVLRPLAKALRLFVQLDETQSHWIPFDLYIIIYCKKNYSLWKLLPFQALHAFGRDSLKKADRDGFGEPHAVYSIIKIKSFFVHAFCVDTKERRLSVTPAHLNRSCLIK